MLFQSRLFFFISFIFFTLFSIETKAQAGKLPPFRIMQANGKVFKAEQLPFEKPILLVYFDPDCHDCQAFMSKFFAQPKSFNKASVAFITNTPLDAVINVSDKYKISTYKNIVIGTEGSNSFIGNYYRYPQLPFAALYDKNGNFISSYNKNIPIDELKTKLEKLK